MGMTVASVCVYLLKCTHSPMHASVCLVRASEYDLCLDSLSESGMSVFMVGERALVTLN